MARTSRIKISRAHRAAVLEKSGGRCDKCYLRPAGQIHHIKAVADGGDDSLENLIGLCDVCHREWHLLMEDMQVIPFADWLEIPPSSILVASLVTDSEAHTLSVADFLDRVRSGMIVAYMRQQEQ